MSFFVNKNLKFLRSHHALTQKEFAEKLGVKVSAIGAYEEERATPPLATLIEITSLFQIHLDTFILQDLSEIPQRDWKKAPRRSREILAITVDKNNKENIELVSQRASAGYLSGYQDPEYVAELPKISIPTLPKHGTYRAFEIQGDSMLPVQPGTLVFGEYVDDIRQVKSGRVYILVTQNDGIVFKRVFNFLANEDKLLLVSDNRMYEPYTIAGSDVLEIWAAKGYYSSKLPEHDEKPPALLDQMALQLFTLQQEIERLKKRK